VATGSYTADGRVVIGHNNWTTYADGERWNVVFDIVPSGGYRILMDGMPGLIHSGDDFGINSAGILITETTISGFSGFDRNGVPEFVRARKAMQYAASIDDFARIMKDGNNGGYANNWLVADRNTERDRRSGTGSQERASAAHAGRLLRRLEFPIDPALTREETTFKPADAGSSANARHARWLELMKRTGAGSTSPPDSVSWPTTTTRLRRRPYRASALCAATSIFLHAGSPIGWSHTRRRVRCRTK
jgi:hypothetical protein